MINTAWLEERFPARLGDGSRYTAWPSRIRWRGATTVARLEPAGAIVKALPLLATADDEPFWPCSGDVFVPGFAFEAAAVRRFAAGGALAQLCAVRIRAPRGRFWAGLREAPRFT